MDGRIQRRCPQRGQIRWARSREESAHWADDGSERAVRPMGGPFVRPPAVNPRKRAANLAAIVLGPTAGLVITRGPKL